MFINQLRLNDNRFQLKLAYRVDLNSNVCGITHQRTTFPYDIKTLLKQAELLAEAGLV